MSILYFSGAKTARDATDSAVPFARRFVFSGDSDALSPIYVDAGLTEMTANPLEADGAGNFEIVYLPEGSYRIVDKDPHDTVLREISGFRIAPVMRQGDLHSFSSLDVLIDDEFLSYQSEDVAAVVDPGTLIRAQKGDWLLEVAPQGAGDAQFTTAGGLKLYEAGARYSTLTRFQAAVARGVGFDPGAAVVAEGDLFYFADDGNVALAGLVGWQTGGLNAALDSRLSDLESDVSLALASSNAATFADMDTLMATTESYSAGQTLETQHDARAFVVAQASVTDAHLTTDNGTKLYEAGPYSTLDALARTAGHTDELRELRDGKVSGQFLWSAANLSIKAAQDPMRGVYVPPASAPDGSQGAWVRQHNGTIWAEWFGATGGADDTDAIQACDEFFREHDEALVWELTDIYTTRGFGDMLSKETYASKAAADAALPDLSDYDVITVASDESQGGSRHRYRVKSGAFVGPLSTRGFNGKYIVGTSAAKRNGFKLIAGAPSWMRLLSGSFSDGVVERVMFNGDNPSSQWGGTQNNPDTELLVEVEGYGVSWRDNGVRFSGGNGVKFRGLVGNFEWSGGDCVSMYNIGWAVVIDQMSSFKATKMWVEGNETGDILLKHDINEDTMTSQKFITAKTYWAKSNVEIESIYSENADTNVPIVQVEGGHFAPRIGQIAILGAGGGGRTAVYLKNNADATGVFKGCKGGFFGLGGLIGPRIICESESWGNIFERDGAMPTLAENGVWIFEDSGNDNVVVWGTPDAAAFTPGVVTGDISVNKGNSHFLHDATWNAQLIQKPGGLLGPVQDYHSNFPTGPGCVVTDNTDTSNGGTELNTILSLNAELPASAKTWYAILQLQAEAFHQVRVGLRDNFTSEYYNWSSRTWSDFGDPDAFGVYRVLRADRNSTAFSLPFDNDGTVRQIRVQVRSLGPAGLVLHHAFVTDEHHPALCAIRSGQALGTQHQATCSTATQPPADAMPLGTTVFNVTEGQMQYSDGTTWVGIGV